ncbi:EAL domain-containing protein [Candidatus Contubernalis alkaliaceticus]|uniref:EAL domain-containing protein n=1 Tax=Candidatus Contubernalis alkaliaceticus TaxID=338645 RepID=UPI001F4C1683|nr:EAL domain-containing protein [Candidatus Contubernalis alkalaceticus]UNC93142.1 EAL domain-containing protein [Candidatus Contubernalis alkalaceticus]
MPLSYIFSLVFFITFAFYFFSGQYILSLNAENKLNRVFFAVCLSLALWTFSFSIANSAPDYEVALFWRRVSSFGWGVLYSLLLHFFLILTERSTILNSRWHYMLLYLPAAVTIFVFGFYSESARAQYNLVNTAAGWTNVSANNWWDWYFNVYYAGYALAGLCLLWLWGRRSKEAEKKKQAYLLIASFTMALLLGTMTDLVVNTYMSFTIPQMAPIIIIFPIMAIFYAIKQYGLMNPSIKSQRAEPGQILSDDNRAKFYQVISLSFILGSMINIVSQYFFYKAPLNSVLLFSTALFIIGLFLQNIQRLPIKADHQDGVFVFLVSASVPLITLRFIEYAGITVWAVPIVFVIISVVYNKQRMIFLLGAFILLTQIWVWVKVPTAAVQIGASDHIARIGILSITLWLAYYVNRVYVQRLGENEDQIKFQKMVSHISADFVTVTESNLDEKINGMLQLIGRHYQVDRTYLFLFSKDQKMVTYTHQWCNEGIEPSINSVKDISIEYISWWMDQILHNGVVHIPDLESLPPEAAQEKRLFKKQQIQSLLSIPVTNKGKILGLLCFDSVKETKTWREDHQEFLRILANLLADALVKVRAEKEINYMAYYDLLTGLPNHTLFKNRLEQAIHLTRRTEKFISVMFMDLDSFKNVNDTMGHEGGDELLKQVASRISGCVRKHDTVCRFGGDELLLLLTNFARAEDISRVCENIMVAFEMPFKVNDRELFITASAGIAVYPVDGEEGETLIKNADLAMNASKNKGKNQFTLCSPVMREDIMKKMQLTNSLYRALERNELMLYYQPQVNVVTKEIIGLEALVRWNHPELGMISPGIFIPLAEQTGLINSIGQWVLFKACHQNKLWQDMNLPPLRMSVNLSVEQFRNVNLANLVANTLSKTGLDSKYLELEITESTAVKEAGYIIGVLQELKELGVTIAIDDFGTEYSSLSRLKTLPVDRIKIDMQFVHGISEGNKDEAIAKIIIQLAKSLELKVTAEGVETEPQVEFFSKQMCDEIQGFYYYKPMSALELEKILLNQLERKSSTFN